MVTVRRLIANSGGHVGARDGRDAAQCAVDAACFYPDARPGTAVDRPLAAYVLAAVAAGKGMDHQDCRALARHVSQSEML
jgi:hypothetical protein